MHYSVLGFFVPLHQQRKQKIKQQNKNNNNYEYEICYRRPFKG